MEEVRLIGQIKLPDGKFAKPTLSPERRQLMISVMDGYEKDLAGTMQILHCYRHCDAFLKFLISSRYTGKNLIALLSGRFAGNAYRLVDYIVSHANKGRLDADRQRP